MSGGITKDRFHNLTDDCFDCVICQQVVINPKICAYCNNIFCNTCINEWIKKKPNCPFKCNNSAPIKVTEIPASIKNLYDDLLVVCSREDCNEVVKLKDLMHHEMNCGISKCFNFDKCGNSAPYTINDRPVCSQSCYIVQMLVENPDIPNEDLLKELEKFVEKVNSNKDSQLEPMKLSLVSSASDMVITNSTTVENKAYQGYYQSAVTDEGFVGGIHYFEVECPSWNKFPAKVGIT